ncbi:ankyrin repeat protein, partial [Pyronema domesticum]
EFRNALYVAASRGHEEIVQLLVERGADIESKDWYGSRPISAAVSYDHYNIVNFLVEKGADKNDMGETALLAVARSGREMALRFLMDYGADINTRARYLGGMALVWVARKGDVALSKFLLDNGADPALLNVRY